MMSKASRWITAALLLSVTGGLQAAPPQEYVGKVDHVYDGQTVRIFYRGGQIRVRLTAIETPQPREAKQALTRLVAGKTVRVKEIRWHNGYLLGHVSVDGQDIGAQLVKEGYAQLAGAAIAEPELARLQNNSRDPGLGAWAQR